MVRHPSPSTPLRAVDAADAESPVTAPSAAELRDLTDELVRRARGGDAQAWARLYQDHFDRLFRDVGYLVASAAVTEELVQETFASALVSLERFRGDASFGTWLRGIAHNLVRKHWRSHARRDRAYARLDGMTPEALRLDRENPERAHLQGKQAQVLQAVLEVLPPPQREAFVLCDVQGVSAADAAERLEISPGNVRVRAMRARVRIREELVRLGWLEGPGGPR